MHPAMQQLRTGDHFRVGELALGLSWSWLLDGGEVAAKVTSETTA